MLYRDRQPVGRLDQGRVHITRDISFRHSRISRLQVLFAIGIQTALRCAHRDDMAESIAALDSHIIRHRPQTVSRIEVPVALGVLCPSPQTLAGV